MSRFFVLAVSFVAFSAISESVEPDKSKWIDDPSALTWQFGELGKIYRPNMRLIADFDGDGNDDMAVNYPPSSGTGGYGWLLYVGRSDGKYRFHSHFFGFSIALERVPLYTGTRTRIWTLSHSGPNDGTLCQAWIEDKGISEPKCVNVYFSEETAAGTRISDAMISAVFTNSDPPIHTELGREEGAEMVWNSQEEWRAIDTQRKEKERNLRQEVGQSQEEKERDNTN